MSARQISLWCNLIEYSCAFHLLSASALSAIIWQASCSCSWAATFYGDFNYQLKFLPEGAKTTFCFSFLFLSSSVLHLSLSEISLLHVQQLPPPLPPPLQGAPCGHPPPIKPPKQQSKKDLMWWWFTFTSPCKIFKCAWRICFHHVHVWEIKSKAPWTSPRITSASLSLIARLGFLYKSTEWSSGTGSVRNSPW